MVKSTILQQSYEILAAHGHGGSNEPYSVTMTKKDDDNYHVLDVSWKSPTKTQLNFQLDMEAVMGQTVLQNASKQNKAAHVLLLLQHG